MNTNGNNRLFRFRTGLAAKSRTSTHLDEAGTTLPYSSKDLIYVMDEEEAIDFIHTDGSPVKLGTAIGIDIDIGHAVQLQLFSDVMFR